MASVGPRAGIDFPVQANGSPVCFQKSFTSGLITVAVQNWVQCVDGSLLIASASVETDSGGLAGCTNLVITTDNDNGPATLFSQAITSLGANAIVNLSNGGTTACTFPFVLELGKYLKINGTAAPGSGTGKVFLNLFGVVLSGSPYLV